MAKPAHLLAEATFAIGCFWDAQHAFDETPGVVETIAGYTGGTTSSPNQKQVSKGGTGHVEAVHIKYDPDGVSYEQLLDVFWRQAPRISILALEFPSGQYAPAIFTHSAPQFSAACESLMKLKKEGKKPVMTNFVSVLSAGKFWPEPDEAHQHFYQKNAKPQWMG